VILTRAFIFQVVDKLQTGEPVVIGLILRRYDVSQPLIFFRIFLRGVLRSSPRSERSSLHLMVHYVRFVLLMC
jgi:hypothetical protein